jgi:hypothetical protein
LFASFVSLLTTFIVFHQFAPQKVTQEVVEGSKTGTTPTSEHRGKKRKVGQAEQEEPKREDSRELMDSEGRSAVMESGSKGKGTGT